MVSYGVLRCLMVSDTPVRHVSYKVVGLVGHVSDKTLVLDIPLLPLGNFGSAQHSFLPIRWCTR